MKVTWQLIDRNRYLLLGCAMLVVFYFAEKQMSSPSKVSPNDPLPPEKSLPAPFPGYDKVKQGMTKGDVRAIMGLPTSEDKILDSLLWTWQGDRESICLVWFACDGTVYCKRIHEKGK